MTCFLWILFAGAAIAQTAAAPQTAGKPPAAAPIVGKTAPATPVADKSPPTAKDAGKTPAAPPRTDKPPPAPKDAGKPPAPPQLADKSPPAPKAPDTFQSAMAKQRAAIAAQREAVRKQGEMATEWQAQSRALQPELASSVAECDPIADVEITPLIDRAAQQHQVDTKLLRGVIEQESGFRPCATSPKGAKGLMQLMPDTIEQFKVDDAFDPQQNIEAGATLLKQLVDRYKGDLKLALAAYNAGPGNVDKTGGIPDIKETQDYVEGIMKKIK